MSTLPSSMDDEEVAAWVRSAMAALDTTPRRRNWRYRALGMTNAEAIAMAPREARLTLHVPVGEMRVLRDVASRRGIGIDTLVRRAVGTWLCACEDLAPEDVPYFTKGGWLTP